MKKKIKLPPYLDDYSSKEVILEKVKEYDKCENTKLSNNLYRYISYIDKICDNFSYSDKNKTAMFYGERLTLLIDEFEIRHGSKNVIMSSYLKDSLNTITSSNYIDLLNYDMIEVVNKFLKMSKVVKLVAKWLKEGMKCNVVINENGSNYKNYWDLHLYWDDIIDRDMYIHIPFKLDSNIEDISVTIVYKVNTMEWKCRGRCKLNFAELKRTIESLYFSKIYYYSKYATITDYMDEMSRFVDYGYKSLIDMEKDCLSDDISMSRRDAISKARTKIIDKFFTKDRDFVYIWKPEIDGLILYSGKYDKFIILSNISIVVGSKRKYIKAKETATFAHMAIFSGDYKELFRSRQKINLNKVAEFKTLVDSYLSDHI